MILYNECIFTSFGDVQLLLSVDLDSV